MTRSRVLAAALLACAVLRSQTVIPELNRFGSGRLIPSDAAVLEVREVNTSLPCVVTPARAGMGFDFAFHAGYQARIKLRDLAGDGNVLTTIFRVTPEADSEAAVYFEQKWKVPVIAEGRDGFLELDGAFLVGEGQYQVDWMVRDQLERVCSAYWKLSARMPGREAQALAGLPRGAVRAAGDDWRENESSAQASAQRYSVAVLLNVGPAQAGAVTVSEAESETLLSILRSIVREPRIGNIAVTAFHMEKTQVVFQQEDVRRVNFVELKKAIDSLPLGTVSVRQLAEPDAEARLLTRLAAEQASRRRLDAMIFIGLKPIDGARIARDALRQLGDVRCPVFYLTYEPASNPDSWDDPIGSAVRYWRGREFNISRPLDLVSAWSKIMAQLGTGSSPNP